MSAHVRKIHAKSIHFPPISFVITNSYIQISREFSDPEYSGRLERWELNDFKDLYYYNKSIPLESLNDIFTQENKSDLIEYSGKVISSAIIHKMEADDTIKNCQNLIKILRQNYAWRQALKY